MNFGSLFTGIGGFDKGFERAGITCTWQSEIDDGCNSVLGYHWPHIQRYGDVRNVGKHNLEPVAIITGGFPCQDLSVTGKRQGLAGERSGLWFEFHRILAELRPRWVVIENVPGLLSGCGCTTCQAVRRIIRIHAWLRERKGGVKCPICIAGERMLKSHSGRHLTIILQGLAEIGYRSAWRILDAQYYGVAQRRRRVFIVGSLGDVGGLGQEESRQDASGLAGLPAKVLFESESLSWDTAPRRQTGQGVTAPVKASAPSRRGGGSWPIAEEFVVWDNAQGDPNAEISETAYSVNPQMNQGIAATLTGQMQGQSNQWAPINEADNLIVQHALSGNNQRNDPDGEHFVVAFKEREGCDGGGKGPMWNSQRAYSVRTVTDQYIGEIYPTLRGQPNQGPGRMVDDAAFAGMVRRLTPTECERLQGFPDGWTAVNGQKDTPRYRQLGNAVCVSVAEWIGRRIKARG